MPRYALAGVVLVTDMAIPELADSEHDGPVWRLDRAGPLVGDFTLVDRYESFDGLPWLEIERDASRYVLRFPGDLVFAVTPAERHISWTAGDDVAASTVRHWLLDQVVPLVLALDGSIVLHASAVVAGGGAVVFVGRSGSGKSSLAASFAATGLDLVADDFVLLAERGGQFAAVPSYPGLRLWPDSAAELAAASVPSAPVTEGSAKRRVSMPLHAGGRRLVPLRAIVVLGDPTAERCDTVLVRHLSAREGLMAAFGDVFRMERSGRERQVAELDRFARLATSSTLLRVEYPRDYASLPSVRAAILGALSASP
jgi:hypothetical protein